MRVEKLTERLAKRLMERLTERTISGLTPKHNILIIDDDIYIGNMLEEMLTREGYGVMRAYSGTEAVLLLDAAVWSNAASAQSETDAMRPNAASAQSVTATVPSESAFTHSETVVMHPDLILLDLMLPGLSGEEILPKMQGIPVIVVSAKAGLDDKVHLLLEGAADYITKPFESRELLARIAVQLRKADVGMRTGGHGNGSESSLREREREERLGFGADTGKTLRFKDLTMRLSEHRVTVADKTVRLTKTEYAILKILMRNPTQVITKSVLLDRISEDTPDCMESSLKVHVSNLRKKLREAGDNGTEYIEAVWGIGFKMKTE